MENWIEDYRWWDCEVGRDKMWTVSQFLASSCDREFVQEGVFLEKKKLLVFDRCLELLGSCLNVGIWWGCELWLSQWVEENKAWLRNIHWWLLGIVIKMLLWLPASMLECTSSSSGPMPKSIFLQMHILGGNSDGPSAWVSTVQMRHIGWILGS